MINRNYVHEKSGENQIYKLIIIRLNDVFFIELRFDGRAKKKERKRKEFLNYCTYPNLV